MSASLGPIHLWLYNKITFQDELTTAILEYAKRKSYAKGDLESVDQRFGTVERGELAAIIDESNIHGWLQERISITEARLAFIVTAVVEEHPESIAGINNVACEFGKQHAVGPEIQVKDAYEYLDTILLNGMPCDGVNQIVSQTETIISWIQTVDIHKPYWDEVNGNVENYYAIRESLSAGIFENSQITYVHMSEQAFELRKEE